MDACRHTVSLYIYEITSYKSRLFFFRCLIADLEFLKVRVIYN